MELDVAQWSGEGEFTSGLIEQLKGLAAIDFVRVEDAPASHTEANYNFISNEVYVRFRREPVSETARVLGILPIRRTVWKPAMTLEELARQLTAMEHVGSPDYSDEAMLQYLRTERIVAPYQTRGYKLVELVRIYRLT